MSLQKMRYIPLEMDYQTYMGILACLYAPSAASMESRTSEVTPGLKSLIPASLSCEEGCHDLEIFTWESTKESKRDRKKSLYGTKHPTYSLESMCCSQRDCSGAEDIWKPSLETCVGSPQSLGRRKREDRWDLWCFSFSFPWIGRWTFQFKGIYT